MLCPPENASSEHCVYKAGLPIILPSGVNLDELVGLDPQLQALACRISSASEMIVHDHFSSDKLIDLDATDPIALGAEASDSTLRSHSTCPVCFPRGRSPFTLVDLSSHTIHFRVMHLKISTSSDPSLDDFQKQVSGSISQLLQNKCCRVMGKTRPKELDNLASTGITESSCQRLKVKLKAHAKATGPKVHRVTC